MPLHAGSADVALTYAPFTVSWAPRFNDSVKWRRIGSFEQLVTNFFFYK